MKAYWGSGSKAPSVLNLGTRLRWAVRFTPRPFCLRGKSPRYLLDKRLSGTQGRSGRGGKEKKYPPLPGIEPRSSNPQLSHYTDRATLAHLHITISQGKLVLSDRLYVYLLRNGLIDLNAFIRLIPRRSVGRYITSLHNRLHSLNMTLHAKS